MKEPPIANRRLLEEGGEERVRAHPDANGHAVGDHRLHGLGAALRIEKVELETVTPEDTPSLAQLGHALLPSAALADGNRQQLLRASDGG